MSRPPLYIPPLAALPADAYLQGLKVGRAEMARELRALVDWCREHTSPHDANSPHELLVSAVAVLNRAEGGQS